MRYWWQGTIWDNRSIFLQRRDGGGCAFGPDPRLISVVSFLDADDFNDLEGIIDHKGGLIVFGRLEINPAGALKRLNAIWDDHCENGDVNEIGDKRKEGSLDFYRGRSGIGLHELAGRCAKVHAGLEQLASEYRHAEELIKRIAA
jgi:hypothetical protein